MIKLMLKLKFIDLRRRLPTCYLLSSKLILTCSIFLLIYILLMDIKLYKMAKTRGAFVPIKNSKNNSKFNENNYQVYNSIEQSYSVFRPLPVKKIMMAEATHYIRSPIADFVEYGLGFSNMFPFISANFISLTHCALSFVSVKFLINDSLFWRQIGVCIFQFRNFLDSFDGVIFRAHAKRSTYKSHYGSIGYFVDAFSDVFGGLCLIGSIAIYLLKNRPLNKNLTKCFRIIDENNTEELIHDKETSHKATKIAILTSVSLLGIRLALSALFWDRSVHTYEDLLDSPAVTELHQKIQINVLKSTITLFIMFSWRLMCALSLQDMILASIFIDKIWEFIVKSQYIGWIALLFLIVLTELHVAEIRSILLQSF